MISLLKHQKHIQHTHKQIAQGEDICICTASSHCCTAEANITLQIIIFQKNLNTSTSLKFCASKIERQSTIWEKIFAYHISDKGFIFRILYIYIYIHTHIYIFSSAQSLSCVWLFATLWIATRQTSLSITNSQSLLKFMPIESVMPSSHLILCHSLLLLPPIPPSIRVFSNESILCMRWPKYWSFSFSINPSNKHPGLIFRMDWLDLFTVRETLKSLLQHHSSKTWILRHSALFTVQLSHPYMTTG